MNRKMSPINGIWLWMILLAILVGTLRGTLDEINQALFESAESAVTLAIALIGPMALWLGVMKVAEAGGLMQLISRALRPLMSRLFPEIPTDHPAMSAIIMNMSANMLGLGNAATPMGIKAMQEMDRLNPVKGEATNSMALFLAINTSSVTLLPLGVITVRAAAGSADPGAILLPSLFATTCSTVVAITACKLMEKKSPLSAVVDSSAASAKQDEPDRDDAPLQPPTGIAPRLVLAVLCLTPAVMFLLLLRDVASAVVVEQLFFSTLSAGQILSVGLREFFLSLSTILIPVILLFLIGFGYFRGVAVYETLTEGAKEGFSTAVRIIPFMVAIMVAIGMVRASGMLDLLSRGIAPLTGGGIPVEAMSLALLRPLSGSGSFALMAEVVTREPNSFLADLVSAMQGSTETTFYVLAVYFGSVGISRTRHALPAALCADITGAVAAFLAVRFFLFNFSRAFLLYLCYGLRKDCSPREGV
ncbi:nucleoside recognition domain-containing protein [Chitinivibrio alkaliphilus]|uniref:Nucleoside recognition domain-containing protein n=1 Tax=Chitinivibrio alkaliphilus ACht1 TaxID=1313304 RepID=U7D7H2_9BACT|nr:nucleoside recognition domain-containing protein [Chitinivibrio alkaliphilus]ERP31878.1 nucleoside recognition domain-containing protein [Chitinivibrio alkaliphilus ACht1]